MALPQGNGDNPTMTMLTTLTVSSQLGLVEDCRLLLAFIMFSWQNSHSRDATSWISPSPTGVHGRGATQVHAPVC
jgi:hypothetical protein